LRPTTRARVGASGSGGGAGGASGRTTGGAGGGAADSFEDDPLEQPTTVAPANTAARENRPGNVERIVGLIVSGVPQNGHAGSSATCRRHAGQGASGRSVIARS
jgi:hypothetical protein